MIKKYVLDTNVLVHDPYSIFSFEDNEVILPLLVIEELDGLKKREGMVGPQARLAARLISELMLQHGSLNEGITLETGGTLRVELYSDDLTEYKHLIDVQKNDNIILGTALLISKKYPNDSVIFVTKDNYARIKGAALGLKVEDYQTDRIQTDELYTGVRTVVVSEELFENFNLAGKIACPLTDEPFYPNQFILLEEEGNPGYHLMAQVKQEPRGLFLEAPYEREGWVWGVRPKNEEQEMALNLMMDDSIPLVTVTGAAGTGKTLLALATALDKVIDRQLYQKIVLIRPVIAAGQDIGYLPGTEEEKLKPWMGSFYDAFERLCDLRQRRTKKSSKSFNGQEKKPNNMTPEQQLEKWREQGIIEMKSFTYMRGRSFENCLLIIDESQETTPHIAKLLLTRAGHNTKIIMIGDPSDNQIDNTLVDSRSNGLVYVMEHLKESDLSGHITLKEVERSPLAKMAKDFM